MKSFLENFLKKKSFSTFFPVPEYLLLSNGGVAINDESVKFVQFSRGLASGRLKLAHYAKIPLQKGAAQAGYIHNDDELVYVLKEISNKYGVHYARAILPEERAYLFGASIGKVPRESMRDAVAFIVEENAPVKLADSVFDFEVVKDMANSDKIKIMVSVLPKKVVEFYTQLFESAGITPVSFDIESQAIARAIIPQGETRTQIIINLAYKKTGFYVVEDEIVQFSITLPVPEGRDRPSAMSELKAEMQKIFNFWDTRNLKTEAPARKIEKVLLCGIDAVNNAFTSDLMKDCPVQYSFANPWVNVSTDLKKLERSDISQEALDYASAIGLALPYKGKIDV